MCSALHSLFRLSLLPVRSSPLSLFSPGLPLRSTWPIESPLLLYSILAPYFFVRYHLSRARLFRSRNPLCFSTIYIPRPRSNLLRKPVSFLSLPPSSRFTGLSRTLSLRCCRLPIFRARETGRYSPLCARSFTMLPRLEPRHRRGRLRGVHSPLEPLHGFVACFAICNACARAANWIARLSRGSFECTRFGQRVIHWIETRWRIYPLEKVYYSLCASNVAARREDLSGKDFGRSLCKYRVTGYYRSSYQFVILKIVRGGRVTRVSRFDFRIGHGYFDSK